MKKLSAETRQRLSESLKAKWASGTRKPNPRSTYEKSSATLKALVAEGRFRPPLHTSEQCSEWRSRANPEKIAAHLRAMSRARRGQPMPPGPSAKGVGHWKARYWEVLSPDRQVYRFINLSEFVRRNPSLFDPRDLKWTGSKCRASTGLRQLFQTKRAPLTWKGWRAIKSADRDDSVGGVA